MFTLEDTIFLQAAAIYRQRMSTIPSDSDHGPEKIVLPEAPAALQHRLDEGGAVAWREPVTIRTYEAGEPSPYPMYLDQRVYQGSSGKVYPLPFIESVADEPVARDWDAVHLENRYLRVMVLPELADESISATTRPPTTTSSTATTSSSRPWWDWPARGSAAASSSTGRSTTGRPPTFRSR